MTTLAVRGGQGTNQMALNEGGSPEPGKSMEPRKEEDQRPLKRISVAPVNKFQERMRLFKTLERALPVRFDPAGHEGVWKPDAFVLFEENDHLIKHAAELGVSCFVVVCQGECPAESKSVLFSEATSLDSRLRGALLVEEAATDVRGVSNLPGDEVLAWMGSAPIWVSRKSGGSTVELVSVAPEELAGNEILKHHLQGTRFLSLLPLYHFLRKVTDSVGWSLPPLRANIHFDDPNLHWRSYGQIDYPSLAAHAEKHNYHASMATIPLDLWYAHPKAVEAFRRNPRRLSLLIHGNNHTSNEFGEPREAGHLSFLLSQALVRAERFERKYSIPVSRVMAFPQEACRAEVIPALMDAGFEGITSTRFLPWNTGFRLTSVPAEESLACFWPAEIEQGSLPVLRRLYLRHADTNPWVKGEMVIGAYLGQPVILYGHHYDLDTGLGLMEEWASRLNSRLNVEWASLERISRGNFLTRQVGDTLHLRLFTRLAVVEVPGGVRRVVAEYGGGQGPNRDHLLQSPNGSYPIGSGMRAEIAVADGNHGHTMELKVLPAPISSARTRRSHIPSVWPYVRRALTEVEDRLRPALVKARIL